MTSQGKWQAKIKYRYDVLEHVVCERPKGAFTENLVEEAIWVGGKEPILERTLALTKQIKELRYKIERHSSKSQKSTSTGIYTDSTTYLRTL